MPRPNRVFFQGAIYHVYNRISRGDPVLAGEGQAERFVELLRMVVGRDDLTVFAWCVMASHYHLAVRMGPVSLDRPMRSLQQRFTHHFNVQNRVFGPLWQGRYRAKLIEDQRYFDQLVAYIHLNPVAAGVVEDPGEYTWSGHREILGLTPDPIASTDEVLRLFGRTRRSARAAYAKALASQATAEWIGESPGRIPWWRLGRPASGDEDDPETAVGANRQKNPDRERRDRPRMSIEAFLDLGAGHLGVSMEDLRGRGQVEEVVRARELLATLGVERYGLRVNKIASALNKHPVTASTWVCRGSRARAASEDIRLRYEELDMVIVRTASGGC